MAENKKAFILYADQKEIFNELPDDYAGKLIKHIFKYVTDENPTTDDILLKVSFALIKTQLKRDLVKYEAKSAVRSDAGRVGGLKSGEVRRIKAEQNEANEANASKSKQNEQDIDIVIDKDIVKEKGKKKFIPPTLSEVQSYFKDNGYRNAEKAFKYYEAANWHDAKGNQVRNWKQKMQGVWFKDENKTTIATSDNKMCLMTSSSHKVPVEKPYSFYLKELSYFGPDEVKLIKLLP